jgi:hypothetical protein
MGWVTTLAKIARLMLQLIEIRPDGKVAGGHNEPP